MTPKFERLTVNRDVRNGILAAADHLEIIVEHLASHGRPDEGMAHAVRVLKEMTGWKYLYTREASK